jgi:hypothetical protein
MDREAYLMLDAIGRGGLGDMADRDRWIDAFKAIRWVVEGVDGPILTAEGRHARDRIAMEDPAKLPSRKPRRARVEAAAEEAPAPRRAASPGAAG